MCQILHLFQMTQIKPSQLFLKMQPNIWMNNENLKKCIEFRALEKSLFFLILILDYYTSSEDISIDLLEQFSDTFYPNLYCGCVEASEKACYEQNILELWGDQVQLIKKTLFYSCEIFFFMQCLQLQSKK